MIKVFTTNRDGKIEFTKDELEKLLDEVWRDGYNSNSSYWWKSPQWSYATTATSPNTISADGLTIGDINMKGNIVTTSKN